MNETCRHDLLLKFCHVCLAEVVDETRRLLQEARDCDLGAGSDWADEVDSFLAGWARRQKGVFPKWAPRERLDD